MKILDREEEEHILQVSSSMFSKSVFICLASLLLMFHAKKKSTCHKSSQFFSTSGFLCQANLNYFVNFFSLMTLSNLLHYANNQGLHLLVLFMTGGRKVQSLQGKT